MNQITIETAKLVVSNIVPNLSPFLGISFAIIESVVSGNNKNKILRKKVLSYLDFINKNIVSPSIRFQDPHIVSGLVTLWDFVSKQRFDWKIDEAYGIFLGFIDEKRKEKFELEKIYHVLNLMSVSDLQLLKKLSESRQKRLRNENQIYVSGENPGHYLNPNYIQPEELSILQSIGLIFAPNLWEPDNDVVITDFGLSFMNSVFRQQGLITS